VDGNLALSRAFGDYQYKDQRNKNPDQQAVTAHPEIISYSRSRNDEFLMVACDGIWDCLSNEECCKLI
jgi:protein phosphatase 2C family protein 2/3